MDKVDEAVDRAIGNTKYLISTQPDLYRTAREGLERLREILDALIPDHPARGRLESYLDELDAWEKKTGLN